MKRFWVLLLVCVMTLCGCEKRQMYFNAAVLELGEGNLTVKCTEAFDSGLSANAEILLSTDVVAADGAPEMAVGDSIRVVFDGEILESDPLQLGTVFAICLLDENGEVVSNG